MPVGGNLAIVIGKGGGAAKAVAVGKGDTGIAAKGQYGNIGNKGSALLKP